MIKDEARTLVLDARGEQAAGLWEIPHRCHQCGHPFGYRYDGAYDAIHLVAIDFICRECMGPFVQKWEDSDDGAGESGENEPLARAKSDYVRGTGSR